MAAAGHASPASAIQNFANRVQRFDQFDFRNDLVREAKHSLLQSTACAAKQTKYPRAAFKGSLEFVLYFSEGHIDARDTYQTGSGAFGDLDCLS